MMQFDRAGLTFDVEVHGPPDGEPVLCLHGFPQDASSFGRVAERLADSGRRVLVPDQRGYSPGARPSLRSAYALPELVGDVVALLDATGTASADVVGHDWGGAVAWALAARRPKRVRRLTVLATAHPAAMMEAAGVGTQGLRSSYIAAFQLPALPEAVLLAGGGRVLRQLLQRSGLPTEDVEHYVGRMREPGALSAALNWYRAVPLALPRLRGIGPVGVPTVYARGEREPAITRTAALRTARHVTGDYQYVELAGAGHWLPETRPELVADLVLRRG